MAENSLVICARCGSGVCLKTELPGGIYRLSCFACGFYTFSNLRRGSALVEDTLTKSPKLYVDLAYYDADGLVWLPSFISVPGKGIVFVEGTSVDDWHWKSCRYIPLTEEEIASRVYPGGDNTKIDFDNGKVYDRAKYMSALHNINYFGISKKDESTNVLKFSSGT